MNKATNIKILWEPKRHPMYEYHEVKVRNILELLKAIPLDLLEKELVDTRRIHRAIFSMYIPKSSKANLNDVRGTYRGETGKLIEKQSVYIKKRYIVDTGDNPRKVEKGMKLLGIKIHDLINSDLDNEEYFKECAGVFVKFLKIHPYVNGNGTIARILLTLLLHIRGLSFIDSWSCGNRPYKKPIGKLIREYDTNKEGLEFYLKGWIKL